MLLFLLFNLAFCCSIKSPVWGRQITSVAKVPFFPTFIPFNASIDFKHQSYRASGFDSNATATGLENRCLSEYMAVTGVDFNSVVPHPVTGVYFHPDAIMSPSFRLAPSGTFIENDSEYCNRNGKWTAGEAVWNVEMQTDGFYGGAKTGQLRRKGHLFSCGRYFFYDPKKQIGGEHMEVLEGHPQDASIISINEYGFQSLVASVRVTTEDNDPVLLTESIAIKKDLSGYYLERSSVFSFYKTN